MDAKTKQAIDAEAAKLNDKRTEGERIVDTIFATIDAKQREGEWIGDSAAALRADLAAAMDERYAAGIDRGRQFVIEMIQRSWTVAGKDE